MRSTFINFLIFGWIAFAIFAGFTKGDGEKNKKAKKAMDTGKSVLKEMLEDLRNEINYVERVDSKDRTAKPQFTSTSVAQQRLRMAEPPVKQEPTKSNYHDEHEHESYCTDDHYITLDSDYDEHPDLESIMNTPRKCPFCGANVRADETVCHSCHHDI